MGNSSSSHNGNQKNDFLVLGERNSKNFNFASQICLGSISNKFEYADTEEISLKENVHDVSVDYNAIDKSDILNIRKF